MTINQIVRNTVERLKEEGKTWTPDAYAEAFCLEAKKAGVAVEDCSVTERFSSMLDKKTLEELKQYRVKTTSELIRFLSSKISRISLSSASGTAETLEQLVHVMAKSIGILHNPDASILAKKTIEILLGQSGKAQLSLLKQAWDNFYDLYDDSFFGNLSSLGSVDKSNLKKTIESLSVEIPQTNEYDFSKIASFLMLGLSPSIAPQMNDDLVLLTRKIHDNPNFITKDEFENEIKTAVAMRVSLDKKSVNEMVSSLSDLLKKLSIQLIDLIDRSDVSGIEIKIIKKDLESLVADNKDDFKTAQQKLYAVATTLEEQTEVLNRDLKFHNKEIARMGSRIAALEDELARATHASREDFLTKLYNKRALDDFLELKEANYNRHGHQYCIAMFDLDHFKKVNDTYGHEAGDVILRAFARILKDEGRVSDVIGRFGGEEFLVILGETDIEGAKAFANKVRKHVQSAHFMYQEKRIEVTVSIGIAQRSAFVSLANTIVAADEQLYLAKKKGRNRVEPA